MITHNRTVTSEVSWGTFGDTSIRTIKGPGIDNYALTVYNGTNRASVLIPLINMRALIADLNALLVTEV